MLELHPHNHAQQRQINLGLQMHGTIGSSEVRPLSWQQRVNLVRVWRSLEMKWLQRIRREQPGKYATGRFWICDRVNHKSKIASRGDRIWTYDLLVPNQTRYQPALRPGSTVLYSTKKLSKGQTSWPTEFKESNPTIRFLVLPPKIKNHRTIYRWAHVW